MKRAAVLSVFAVLAATAVAQNARNSLYAELLGNGLLYSCNYERLITESFGVRIGASFFEPENVPIVTFPLMANYLVGSGSSKLELGLGICVLLMPENVSLSFMSAVDEKLKGNSVLGTATVGYRYQPADGGLVFRAGVTPFFGVFAREKSTSPYLDEYEDVFGFRVLGGVSVGYAF